MSSVKQKLTRTHSTGHTVQCHIGKVISEPEHRTGMLIYCKMDQKLKDVSCRKRALVQFGAPVGGVTHCLWAGLHTADRLGYN